MFNSENCILQEALSVKPGDLDSQSSLASGYPEVTLTRFFPGKMEWKQP